MANMVNEQLEEIWQSTLALIKSSNHFDDANFNTWFKESAQLYDIVDDMATIVVPYKIHKQVLMENIDFLQEKLSQVVEKPVSIQILLKNEVAQMTPQSVVKRRNDILFEDKIKKDYTFDSFVVGKNNREAHAAALSVCYYPGKFNTLYLR